jgi:hypothetical protein
VTAAEVARSRSRRWSGDVEKALPIYYQGRVSQYSEGEVRSRGQFCADAERARSEARGDLSVVNLVMLELDLVDRQNRGGWDENRARLHCKFR